VVGVKIHAYKVVPRGQLSLDQVLAHLNGIPLDGRMRTVSDGEIRLESANKTGDIWALDFGGLRPDGPGRASATTPISDFDMNEDEDFAQETAAIYNVASGYMALQYNHFGPRHGRIQGYLFRFSRLLAGLEEDVPNDDDHGFTLSPVIKRDSVARLNRADVIKNLDVSVFLPGLTELEEAKTQSLSSFLEHPILGNAEELRFQIRASRRKGATLDLAAIRRFVGEMLGLGGEVSSLQVHVKESEEDPSELLDLLDARLFVDVAIDREGRRYGRNTRWALLKAALDAWAAAGQLH
jgi:hypothetical protein